MIKKSKVAVLLFLILGFSAYSFANPSEKSLESKKSSNISEKATDEKKSSANNSNETIVATQNYQRTQGNLVRNVATQVDTNNSTTNNNVSNNNSNSIGNINYEEEDIYKTPVQLKELSVEDLTDVIFDDETLEYNGKSHDIKATNLPKWVTVEYVNNTKVNPQTAVVTAKVTAKSGSGYVGTVKLTATLTITKKQLTTDELANVVFEDETVEYNGKSHDLKATNLPSFVTVEYVNNTKVNVQNAVVTAKIKAKENSNYTGTVKLTAKLSIVDTTSPSLILNGTSQTVEAGSNYDELNATATDLVDGIQVVTPYSIHYRDSSGKYIGSVDHVDTMKTGEYKISYRYTDKAGNIGKDASRSDHDYVMRIINVVDTTSPELSLNGTNQTIEVGSEYVELNATSKDILDGVTTVIPEYIHYRDEQGNFIGTVDHIDTSKLGQYKIRYSCKDNAGNLCKDASRSDHDYVIRTVNIVDTTAPLITLNGEKNLTLSLGEEYIEAGAKVVDNYDGIIKEKAWPITYRYYENPEINKSVLVNSVDTTKAGVYKLMYIVKDSHKNQSLDADNLNNNFIIRTVTVKGEA